MTKRKPALDVYDLMAAMALVCSRRQFDRCPDRCEWDKYVKAFLRDAEKVRDEEPNCLRGH